MAGRGFVPTESPQNRVALINEALARKLFNGQDAIGQHAFIGGEGYDIVGVVSDYAEYPLEQRHTALRFFLPLRSDGTDAKRLHILIRTVSIPAPLVRSVTEQHDRANSRANTYGEHAIDVLTLTVSC